MASDGNSALSSYAAASYFLKDTLVKVTPKITLKWSAVRMDPLTPQIAVLVAIFHEDTSDASGKRTPYEGYFTATVYKTESGWRYRTVHWPLKPGK